MLSIQTMVAPVPFLAFHSTSGKNADLSSEDEKGFTPLYIASKQENKTVFNYLISKGAKIDTKDNLKETIYQV